MERMTLDSEHYFVVGKKTKGVVSLFSVFSFLILSFCSRKLTPIPDMESPEAKVYITRCSGCHALPHPSRLDMVRWRKIIKVMKIRMQERGYPPMTEDEEKMILEYLRKYSRK